MYLNIHTHLLPVPYSYTPIAISICMHVSIILYLPLIICMIQLQYVAKYLFLDTSPDVYTLVTPCLFKGLYFNIHVSILPINTHIPCLYKFVEFLYAPPLPICAFFNTVCICTYSILLDMHSCVYVYTKTVLNTHEKNQYRQMDMKQYVYMHVHIKYKHHTEQDTIKPERGGIHNNDLFVIKSDLFDFFFMCLIVYV